jgi:signal transduction histidine kinase
MLPDRFIRGYDRRRLRNLLALLFTALSIPTGVVIWQAYDQLKWEAWYQHRSRAEAFVNRVDGALAERVAATEGRSFTDFEFLVPTAPAGLRQRSPLSGYPVPQDLPGVIGYFQVNPDGTFSTPLLPGNGLSPAAAGLSRDDYERRGRLASEIRRVLADNRLVDTRSTAAGTLRQERDLAELASLEDADVSAEQAAFDQLNQPAGRPPEPDARNLQESRPAAAAAYGSVQDLRLDESLQLRSENRDQSADPGGADAVETRPVRARRVEKSVAADAPAIAAEAAADLEATITTFESEIDPYQFSRLGSGHFVLFRNVWLDGSRFVQGMLIDQSDFSGAIIEAAFRDTTLAATSDLVVGYRDDVIKVIRGGSDEEYAGSTAELEGSLLYRRSLSAPLDSLELIVAANRMPPGPGASVLAWTTALIAIVFASGFFALYRLGLGQIRLARQQQDFVSAVSHELKTPLTSIRMYGEMLREGWVDDEKRQQYYEYIHDESERLSRLISNVLQLARISRDEPQINLKPVRVTSLLDQVRSKIAKHAEGAGFELILNMDDNAGQASVEIDDDCFSQIVINLVDNAIKFSKHAERRQIDIGCSIGANGEVTFRIRDYGPGIPGDQLKKVFRLFYRPESELTRETVGTGIGLAIVHQLTTAMGGTVNARNCQPGAEFAVTFPTC